MRPSCHKMGKKVATSCAEEGSLQAGIGFSISPGQALFSGDFIGEAALELVQGELLSPRCMLHMSKLTLQLLHLSFCCPRLVFPLQNTKGVMKGPKGVNERPKESHKRPTRVS